MTTFLLSISSVSAQDLYRTIDVIPLSENCDWAVAPDSSGLVVAVSAGEFSEYLVEVATEEGNSFAYMSVSDSGYFIEQPSDSSAHLVAPYILQRTHESVFAIGLVDGDSTDINGFNRTSTTTSLSWLDDNEPWFGYWFGDGWVEPDCEVFHFTSDVGGASEDGGSSPINGFGNHERREQERQQRLENRRWFEDAVRGRHGSRLQRQLASQGIDAGSMHIFGDVWFKNPDMGSGAFDRQERECLYLATGLTKDEAVLPLIKGTIEAMGQKVLYEDDFYLNHPGRWPFDTAVGVASNPLTYPSILVAGGGLLQGGRRMLALRAGGTVTHWGPASMTHLQTKNWVMVGPPPRYLLSGKGTLPPEYVPFGQRIHVEVPRSSLTRPPGVEGIIKYPFGQRSYVGPNIPATKINTPSPRTR